VFSKVAVSATNFVCAPSTDVNLDASKS